MNNKTDIDVQYVSPLKKICMTIGELPSSYLETMSYYEMLVWFTEFLKNQVIPTVNNNAEAVQELQSLYEELRTYVNNYFDNLDVQDEINNKLDEMAESGQLTDIIAQYLGLAGMIAFDTVADMKEATNLVNGSKCRTLGYHSVNDGGGSYYKIRQVTNDDVVDEMSIIAVYDNLLVAELIIENNEINTIQAGCKVNDNTFDNGVVLNKLLNFANNKGINVLIVTGDHYISTPVVINEKLYAIKIHGIQPKSNLNGSALIYTGTGYCLTLAQGGLKYTLSDFTVSCNGTNSGINCEGSGTTTLNFKNYLTNITVTSAIIGMRVVSTTYTMIDNYTFGGHANTEVGLQIEGFEFTYINNSSIDGYSNTDSNSIGLKITGGINTYVNNIDICNFGQGKAVYMTNTTYNLYNIYFNNMNILRCDGGVFIDAQNSNINSLTFENTIIALSGTNEGSHYFYVNRPSTYVVQNVDINNLTIRNLANTLIPDYVYEQSTGGIYGLSLTIKDLYSCPVYKSGIKGGTSDRYYYRNEMIYNQGMKYITTDGTSSQYMFEIEYPKMSNPPFINIYVVAHHDFKLSNPAYDDTTHKLKTNITFDSPPAQGNVRIGYMISEYGSVQ